MANLQTCLFILVTLAITLSSLQAQAHNQLFNKVTHRNIPTDPSILNDNEQQNEATFNPAESGEPFDKYPKVIYNTNTNTNNDNRYNNIDDLRMSERDGYTYATRNGMNQYYNNRNRHGYGNGRPRRRRENNNYNNYVNNMQYNIGQPQGMSDTRLMENGKYYYDLNRESEDPNGYQNWRAVALTNTDHYNQNRQISAFQDSYNIDDDQNQYVP